MIKKVFLIFISISTLFSLTLTTTKKRLQQNKYHISKMNEKLDKLAKKIAIKQNKLNLLNQQIQILNQQIKTLNQQLLNSNKTLSTLNDLKNGYKIKVQNFQNEITNFISENYFNTILKPDNVNDLINKEITEKILNKYSQKIAKITKENAKLLEQIKNLNLKINNIKTQQKELLDKKEELAKLLIKQKKELQELKKEKLIYRKKLQKLLNEQRYLQNELARLKIIKRKRKIVTIPSNINTTNLNVRKIGSIYYKPKIAVYRGPKTIPPVYGKIIKKFGSYIDPVYKIRIYNDSITIKPYQPNSVVRAIFSGRVVYIGNNDDKKIIIIKHKHNLFSIYANLSKISPILKKGFYVKKGQIIARVKNSLEFEITYKENPINPLEVINLK